MECTLTRPTEDLKEKRTAKRLSGSFKRLRIKAKDKFSRGAKTTVTVEEVSEDQTKATPTCQDPQPNTGAEENERENQSEERKQKEEEQKDTDRRTHEQWRKENQERQDRFDQWDREYAEEQKKQKLEEQQGEWKQLDKDLELQRRMEERLRQEKLSYLAYSERQLNRKSDDAYDIILKEEAKQRKEQQERDQKRDQELQQKMEERVREEKLRAASIAATQGTEETSRPTFRPYTVSDLERERFQRVALGMDSRAVEGSNNRGRHNYDVEVLW